ncbi:unnamed protein product [Rotaria sp. Silwood1]|nr:unnamed protein product [Rotaria sp. Silwood1]
MPDPLAVYVPVAALTKPVVRSILFAVLEHERRDWNHSRRTLLAFLLALNKKLEEIEASVETRHKIGDQIIRQVDDIRQWLVYEDDSGNRVEPNWDELRATYQKMIADKVDDTWTYYGGHRTKPYYELIISVSHPDIERSRVYMTRTRQNGFQSNELKLYWNAEQLEILCPKFGSQGDKFFQPPHDPSDADAVEGLCQYPVWQRNHSGKITYVTKGIEKTVFDVPKDAQIILLSFADEQSPGGGYLIRASNTKGDGSNTYLLLGPIGTGAFGNDVHDIANLFREVLQSKMMSSNGPIRQAFGNIWFVSIDAWKNDIFKEILSNDEI